MSDGKTAAFLQGNIFLQDIWGWGVDGVFFFRYHRYPLAIGVERELGDEKLDPDTLLV